MSYSYTNSNAAAPTEPPPPPPPGYAVPSHVAADPPQHPRMAADPVSDDDDDHMREFLDIPVTKIIFTLNSMLEWMHVLQAQQQKCARYRGQAQPGDDGASVHIAGGIRPNAMYTTQDPTVAHGPYPQPMAAGFAPVTVAGHSYAPGSVPTSATNVGSYGASHYLGATAGTMSAALGPSASAAGTYTFGNGYPQEPAQQPSGYNPPYTHSAVLSPPPQPIPASASATAARPWPLRRGCPTIYRQCPGPRAWASARTVNMQTCARRGRSCAATGVGRAGGEGTGPCERWW
ncbi:hypothetical protein JB92DRAFT_3144139 [Gautieria morchelliformis]|nr:hypothetical protein JB92DRAFT_3144139 [Gautieria morchelliformis]